MRFDVWAPLAHNDIQLNLGKAAVPMQRSEDGWWSVEADASPGDRYAFSVDGGDERPDPRSLAQPDGPHARSAVVDLSAHTWGDASWQGTTLDDAIIYELHIGTFTSEGTFDAAIGHLDHLAALGVTLVELMPVVSFPGSRGWGYDGVSPYAVHEAYGGAEGLQRFVDAAHQRGLGVCLDVVYNHLGPSGNYLPVFGPYFTDRHHTPWGQAVNLDGPDSDEVRRYFIDNALMWFRDFHLDALRLDAVHALIDDRAVHFLEDLAAQTDSLSSVVGRPLTLIAESDRNDPATVTPRAAGGAGGLGLHAQWVDDVHHTWHVLLTGETQGYYADFADADALAKTGRTPFFHDGTWSTFRGRQHGRPVDPAATDGRRFVASLQTHDQVGNRATGERLSHLVSPGRCAIGAALLLTSPYVPMLFMGEEWGASTPWQYFTDHEDPELAAAVSKGRREEFADHGWGGEVPDPQDSSTRDVSVLRWDELAEPSHAALLDWYRTLISLRRNVADLGDPSLETTTTQREGDLVTITRGAHRVVCNLGDTEVRVAATGHVLAAFDASMDAGGDVIVEPDGVAILAP
ncbi:malto-oligosyltrehalose trehalohydrolase [Calidifontibacter sp. DB0510]|uniref:Malto-oligosyltrehalose trehalohydrolase n=1 Tax=Metallococcus carri TaxID=1656884 RepID=A0A967E8Q7_9MICO|nr:malto-oligosyltrehalose trehalohydrolase [Metallococcus carri]NHN55487.1 malto-oligosyltrehalose trehalohydrolase [Metallococcus carri]NOP38329.1 malto-oligosyltrehalose trehalohydrolase [Calidifontibacter sp. DB2511S]